MPGQSTPLRDMINDALGSGVTYRELETRAIDEVTGKRASRAIFFDIATGKLDRMPYEHHLRAIAAGLRAPYESVRQAAIEQWLPPVDPANPGPAVDAMRREMQSMREQLASMLTRLDDEHPDAGAA